MRPRLARCLLLAHGASLAACGPGSFGSGGGTGTVEVVFDPLLSLDTFIGGDLRFTVEVRGCDETGTVDAVAWADGLDVAYLADVELQVIDLVDVDDEPRAVFTFSVPGSSLPPGRFGVPVRVDLVVEVACDGATGASAPFSVTYLPTDASVLPAFNPRRFWAAATPGDLLSCTGTALGTYRNGVAQVASDELGFSCALAEIDGPPAGRRYLRAEGGGLAAIDSGGVTWSVPLDLRGLAAGPTDDPVIIAGSGSTQSGRWELSVLRRGSGQLLAGPVELPGVPLGDPIRAASGEILVLEGERPPSFDTLTYRVRRFSAELEDLGAVEVVHYGWDAPSYIARFDLAGRFVYVTRAPESEEQRALAKIDLEDCPDQVCAAVWESPASAGWEIPLGEAGGRLLAASADALGWLDPATGATLGGPFGPASGNRFLRALLSEDGSLTMLADPVGEVSRGLYVFDPEGEELVRLRSDTAVFRWLAPGWDDAALVSYFDELHLLHPPAVYGAMVPGPR